MRQKIKLILKILFSILIVIQFFHPQKNIQPIPNGGFKNDIATLYPYPDSVKNILQTSCYDCHSNNTSYPWYSKIQPVAWWLNSHINEGKEELNFNDFAAYRIGRQYRKLEKFIEEIKEEGMPLPSYTLIHTYAKLNNQQKNIVTNWASEIRDTIKAKYPADSLVKKK